MTYPTSKALNWTPSAGAGISVTPNGTAWANSSWVQLIASTSGAIQIEEIAINLGVAGQDFEIDFRLDEAFPAVNSKATVIRKELPNLAGVKFVDLTPIAKTAIRGFIATQVQF